MRIIDIVNKNIVASINDLELLAIQGNLQLIKLKNLSEPDYISALLIDTAADKTLRFLYINVWSCYRMFYKNIDLIDYVPFSGNMYDLIISYAAVIESPFIGAYQYEAIIYTSALQGETDEHEKSRLVSYIRYNALHCALTGRPDISEYLNKMRISDAERILADSYNYAHSDVNDYSTYVREEGVEIL